MVTKSQVQRKSNQKIIVLKGKVIKKTISIRQNISILDIINLFSVRFSNRTIFQIPFSKKTLSSSFIMIFLIFFLP